MKKEFFIVILLTIVIFMFLLYFGIFSRHKFSNLIISEEEYESIISTRDKKDDLLIEDLKFNDLKLFYDSKNNIYYYSLNKTNNAYSPFIKYRNIKTYAQIAFLTDINDESIKANSDLTMLIYTKDEYNILTIKCTTLPILTLNYDGELSKEEYTNSNLFLYDNNLNKTYSFDSKIKYRGISSFSMDKKGYRITLLEDGEKKNASLLGMRKDDDWILYAAYNDQEKIRNVFSSKLWYDCCSKNNSYNLDNGMEYKYVELFINDEYMGLYALGYPIDEKTLKVTNEYMFKKTSWEDYIEKNTEDNLAGYEIVNDVLEKDAISVLKKYYLKIFNSTSKEELVSLSENAIDIFLFYNLIQGSDNAGDYFLKNTYLTFKDNGKVIYTPWDMDYTFGNGHNYQKVNFTKMYEVLPSENIVMKLNPIYKARKFGKDVQESVYSRYKELRNTTWSDENVIKLLESYEEDIYFSGAFLRDKERWPKGNYNNPNVGLSKFKSYVIERLEYMDKYIEEYTGIK